MSVNNKRWLSNIVYYTLAILALLASAFFVYCLVVNAVAMWAKIIYFVWAGLVIGAVIFDVICTTTGESKQISGLIIYVLSLMALAMACILYFINTGMGGFASQYFNLFISISFISLLATGFLIATWVVGQSRVENEVDDKERRERVSN